MPVGMSMSNDTLYHVKSQTTGNPVSGWQCYIYGNAVYNKLFQEWVKHAESFIHSRIVVPGGSDQVCYELLRDSGVRCGAYLRTTNNSDGSYSSNVGHSMIILTYDSETITYLEGNADGNGLIRVAIRTWDDFNLRQLSGRGRYISHMVQPTDEFYDAQFPSCTHSYEGYGICTLCGEQYNWEGTLAPWAKAVYRVTEKVTPRADAPYSTAVAAELTLLTGQQILTTGQYRNAYDQIWYSAEDEKGNVYYVNGASLKFVEYPDLEATCTGFSPEDGAILEQKSYPVKGTVSANYPLKSVSGYLDGVLYATWTAADENTTQVDLRKTDINNKLSFSKLEGGRHRLMLVAESFVHDQPVTVHESGFFTVSPEPCNHDYIGSVTRDATCAEDGLLTYTCSKCDDAYQRTILAPGHEYQGGVCIQCGEQQPAVLTGTVRSGGKQEDPVTVTVTREGGLSYVSTVSSQTYTVTGIQPGTYIVKVTKAGCVEMSGKLVLESGENTWDVKLSPVGDVSGDCNLNIGDVGKLYAHVRGKSILQDAYVLLCADYNADGTVNIGDVVKLYGTLRK